MTIEMQRAGPLTEDALQRLKILIDSSTPIIAMETVEEVRAVRMVRAACASLNLAVFEWSIASGLMRSGSTVGEVVTGGYDFSEHSLPGSLPGQPLQGRSLPGHAGMESIEQNAKALYNSREPAQMLGNLEGFRSTRRLSLRICIGTWMIRLWCGGCAMWGRDSRPTGRRLF